MNLFGAILYFRLIYRFFHSVCIYCQLGSQSEIPCTVFDVGKLRYSCLLRHYLLLHFPNTSNNWRKASGWSAYGISVIFWNSAIFVRGDRCGEYMPIFLCTYSKEIMTMINSSISRSLIRFNQIMPLENEMKTPKSFVGITGILNQAFGIIVCLYVGMGLFGYLCYGEGVADSITLSLPEHEM